jgi:predicted site-specific integrase-resolvase
MSDDKTKIPQRLFHPRAEVCQLLGISLPILNKLVEKGRLTPVRLTGAPKQGRVFFSHDELVTLHDSLLAKARAKRQRTAA